MRDDRIADIGWGEIRGAKRLPPHVRVASAISKVIGDWFLETLACMPKINREFLCDSGEYIEDEQHQHSAL